MPRRELRPGGSLIEVAGLKVGHFTSARRPTGCTVVLAEDGAVAGVEVRGGSPGTRETELLSPLSTVEQLHAVVLSGGSAFGLDTASGVMRYLEEKDIGFDAGAARVPIVAAAILNDLGLGDPKIRPDADAGYQACLAAATMPPAEGNVGVGTGATLGKLYGLQRAMKGGVGTASLTVGGITVGALVVVNALGDIFDPRTGELVAGARTHDGRRLLDTPDALLRGELPAALDPGQATTLGVVATDAMCTKIQVAKVAQMAHAGLARTIRPIHTPLDGDTIFALATGRAGKPADPLLVGFLAAEALAQAVLRAVWTAVGLPGFPSASQLGH
ncbi:MAG: peptidase S58 family protein [Candidatus Latescibacteria bacterium]|nr:peptidase S58 family protein [Candidatus Latescibacterota bacterium]